MIDENRKHKAQKNLKIYLEDGLIKKERNEEAKKKYLENAQLSLSLAKSLFEHELKPYIWIIVISYYSMFYIANAILLHLGYKVGEKIAHKVTIDALIVLVLGKLKNELLEHYESLKEDASEFASIRSEELLISYERELDKRSRFQYNMLEEMKAVKAKTSVERAAEFIFEMNKLLK